MIKRCKVPNVIHVCTSNVFQNSSSLYILYILKARKIQSIVQCSLKSGITLAHTCRAAFLHSQLHSRSCSIMGHWSEVCPLLHFMPLSQMIIGLAEFKQAPGFSEFSQIACLLLFLYYLTDR